MLHGRFLEVGPCPPAQTVGTCPVNRAPKTITSSTNSPPSSLSRWYPPPMRVAMTHILKNRGFPCCEFRFSSNPPFALSRVYCLLVLYHYTSHGSMVYGTYCVFVVMSLCLSPNYADNRVFKHFAEVPGVLLPLLK